MREEPSDLVTSKIDRQRRGGNSVNDDQLSSFNCRSRHRVYEVIRQEEWKVTLPIVQTVRLVLPDPNGTYVKENEDIPGNTAHNAFNRKPVLSPVSNCCDPRCQSILGSTQSDLATTFCQ